MIFFFFFSSRRRHTRWNCDWSSDVCSSDLRARARGVATDMRYGLPLSGAIAIADGDYGDLEGASVVVVAAGINEKTGGATDRNDPAGRLRLLDANIKIYEDIVPRIVSAAPQ